MSTAKIFTGLLGKQMAGAFWEYFLFTREKIAR